jgi:hypothetical protein
VSAVLQTGRRIQGLVRIETVTGPEWTDGRTTVTPVARSLTIGAAPAGEPAQGDAGRGVHARPFIRCSRPSSVIVAVDGSTTRMPIVDVTRWAQLAIVLIGLLALWEIWELARTQKERS